MKNCVEASWCAWQCVRQNMGAIRSFRSWSLKSLKVCNSCTCSNTNSSTNSSNNTMAVVALPNPQRIAGLALALIWPPCAGFFGNIFLGSGRFLSAGYLQKSGFTL